LGHGLDQLLRPSEGRSAGLRLCRANFVCSPAIQAEASKVLRSFLYLLARRVLALATLRFRSERSKEIELVILRHELAVLRHQVSRPQLGDADPVFLAAASRLLPRRRWSVFFVRPETLPPLAPPPGRRHWTSPGRTPRRPPLDPKWVVHTHQRPVGERLRRALGGHPATGVPGLGSGPRPPRSSWGSPRALQRPPASPATPRPRVPGRTCRRPCSPQRSATGSARPIDS
jgi:hypothetical protein